MPLVIASNSKPVSTDWDLYYQQPARLAAATRRITTASLLRAMRRFVPRYGSIAELGGANSCFFEAMRSTMEPREYHIVDRNQFGLDQFRHRHGATQGVRIHCQDIRDLRLSDQLDLAFSVGLVEHFDAEGTARAVAAHFRSVRPGGIVLISFPTPTWLYRAARRMAELAGVWIFHDERPLRLEEIQTAARPFGDLMFSKILWPIVFTQCLTVWRKRPHLSEQD